MEPGKRHFTASLFFPVFVILILWMIKTLEWYYEISFARFGVLPRETKGIIGILFSPFIHGSFNHLVSNSVPLLVLSVGLLYFYRKIAYKVLILLLVLTGMCVWIGGRPVYHIGASGIVYGLASFIFFSGIYRKNRALLAISLLTIFLYGGLFWGLFPVEAGVSWESHVFGFVTGLALAAFYRNEKVYEDEQHSMDDTNISTTYDYEIFYDSEEE